MNALLAIAIGASFGAILRWALSQAFLHIPSPIPLGTLCANLLGGFLIGWALAFFAQRPELAPEWRLLVITGFLGGLTTFSTFSGEVVEMLMGARWSEALATIALHLLGSLAMTALGLLAYRGWSDSA